MIDEQKQLVIDYQITFDSDSGRRVFENLRKWSGYEDRIEPTPDDTLATLGFALGKRNMFLHIIDKINADPSKEVQTEAETEAEDAID